MKHILLSLLLFFTCQVHSFSETEIDCLSKNIYFEAGNQSNLGKLLVGIVTMNRVYDDRYPSTICGVVRKKNHFSWFWDGISDISPKNGTKAEYESWEDSKDIAGMILSHGHKTNLTKLLESFPATHYHAITVLPFWVDDLVFIAQIEDHKFYRWD